MAPKTQNSANYDAESYLEKKNSVPALCSRKCKEGGRKKKPIADFLVAVLLRIAMIVLYPLVWMFGVIHDKLMMKFINASYIYNVSWEDPRMDQEVFQLSPEDHIITIASAGDNVFDYLIEGSRVTAVDFNACQIALTELKAVACQNLDFEDFFEIFSMSNIYLLKDRYSSVLRDKLTEPSRKFWDQYIQSIKSFMYSGTSGWMAFFLFRFIMPLFGLGFIRTLILSKPSPEAFQEVVKSKIHRIRRFTWFLDKIVLKCCALFAGVPQLQLNLGLHREDNAGELLDRLLFNTDMVHDNYFYAGYFLGYYPRYNAPRYLQEENYLALRRSLDDGKLTLFHGSIEDCLRESKDNTFTVASLLDHMDWMTVNMINDELSLLMDKLDREKGRIYWRSFSENVHSAPLRYLNPIPVDDTTDRVGMYWSTWIAHMKNTPFTVVRRIKSGDYNSSMGEMIKTGFKIVSYPLLKPVLKRVAKHGGNEKTTNSHGKDMEAFYAFQKKGYDNFREKMLHARPVLMDIIPVKQSKDMVWVDIGGGTARNIEFLPVDVIKTYFKQIVIVDISKSLLEIAKQRCEQLGISGIVRLVEFDVTDPKVFQYLPLPGAVDIVTMSYSLSMIPDKHTAIQHAMKLLKPNGEGFLGIADFFMNDLKDPFRKGPIKTLRKGEAFLHKQWFKQDHVHLLTSSLVESIKSQGTCEWDERFRGGVPLMPFLRPVHGAFVCRTKQPAPEQ
jgi:ubiquinone/menaquinone biosynthesis C-methylase UbiE